MTPFFSLTDEDGAATIKHLDTGEAPMTPEMRKMVAVANREKEALAARRTPSVSPQLMIDLEGVEVPGYWPHEMHPAIYLEVHEGGPSTGLAEKAVRDMKKKAGILPKHEDPDHKGKQKKAEAPEPSTTSAAAPKETSEREKWPCPHCDFEAAAPIGLNSHVRSQHPEKVEKG